MLGVTRNRLNSQRTNGCMRCTYFLSMLYIINIDTYIRSEHQCLDQFTFSFKFKCIERKLPNPWACTLFT